jgi:hypothetical protein
VGALMVPHQPLTSHRKSWKLFGVDQASLVPLHATCHVPGNRFHPMLLELCAEPMGSGQRPMTNFFVVEPAAMHSKGDPIADF